MTAAPHSVTRPLNLRQFLRTAPSPGLDFIAIIDLLVITAIFALSGSSFIFAPGTEVDLARTEYPELGGSAASVVLTVGRNETLFFQGQKIAPEELPQKLGSYIAERKSAVLLLKLDRSLELETVFDLMDTARAAGFARVQLAAEEGGANEKLFRGAAP